MVKFNIKFIGYPYIEKFQIDQFLEILRLRNNMKRNSYKLDVGLSL